MTTKTRSPRLLGRLAACPRRWVATWFRHRLATRSRRPAALLAAGGVVAALLSQVTAAPASAAPASVPHYSLPLALQESLYFYDAQKPGPARTDGDQPLDWRGDDAPSDSLRAVAADGEQRGHQPVRRFHFLQRLRAEPSGTGCLNLSGGFHDAGDTVKFGLPQSYAASVLGWGMYEFPQAYTGTGTCNHAMDKMKRFSHYFLRSTFLNSSGQVVAFSYQVGQGRWTTISGARRSWRTRPSTRARPTWPPPRCRGRPGGERRGRARRGGHPDRQQQRQLLAECLKYAEALYSFALANPGTGYSGGFYNSSGYVDKEAWAAVWLYLATGTWSYISQIVSTDGGGSYTGYLAATSRTPPTPGRTPG